MTLYTACTPRFEIQEVECSLIKSYTEYPDSSFFKDINCLYEEDGTLCVFDQYRGDVAVWDIAHQSFYTVGKIGGAPHELTRPVGFYPYKDTLYILDGGSVSLKTFVKGRFINSSPVASYSNNRFFVDGDTVFMTAVTDSTSYIKMPKYWRGGEENVEDIMLCGTILPVSENQGINYSRNLRQLCKGNGCLYSICRSYPVVEKYDLQTNSLLCSYDLSEIPFIEDVLEQIEGQHLSENTEAIFLRDVYWYNSKLYLLCADWEEEYEVNTIISLRDDGILVPDCIYKLPDRQTYCSIAVNDDYIYASNYSQCSIDIFNIPQ